LAEISNFFKNVFFFVISDVNTGFVIVSKEDCDSEAMVAGTDRQEMFSKLEKDLIEQVILLLDNWNPLNVITDNVVIM
jgi:hypothetical protein